MNALANKLQAALISWRSEAKWRKRKQSISILYAAVVGVRGDG